MIFNRLSKIIKQSLNRSSITNQKLGYYKNLNSFVYNMHPDILDKDKLSECRYSIHTISAPCIKEADIVYVQMYEDFKKDTFSEFVSGYHYGKLTIIIYRYWDNINDDNIVSGLIEESMALLELLFGIDLTSINPSNKYANYAIMMSLAPAIFVEYALDITDNDEYNINDYIEELKSSIPRYYDIPTKVFEYVTSLLKSYSVEDILDNGIALNSIKHGYRDNMENADEED